jgi:hypothetical protein
MRRLPLQMQALPVRLRPLQVLPPLLLLPTLLPAPLLREAVPPLALAIDPPPLIAIT